MTAVAECSALFSSERGRPGLLSRQNSTLAPLVVYFWGQSNCNEPAAYTGVLPFVLDTRICLYRHTGAMDRCGPTASGFHGMEIYLGTTLANATGRQVVIVKSSVDATSITTWLPGQTHDIDTQIPAAANAMRHPSDLDVQCVVLHGESDTAMSAATYQADLTILYARIRALLPGRGVRFHQLLLNVNDFQTGDPTTVRAG